MLIKLFIDTLEANKVSYLKSLAQCIMKPKKIKGSGRLV